MTVEESSEKEILAALRNMIVELGITPIADCHAVSAGDKTVTVTDPEQFLPGQLFEIYDDLELPVPIDSNWSGDNPVTFNWAGTDQDGFRFDHADMWPCGTGLFTEAMNNLDNMILADKPFIQLISMGFREALIAGHLTQKTFTVHLEIRRSLIQPRIGGVIQGPQYNTNRWGIQQQRACKQDMLELNRMLLDNPTLTDHNGSHAMFIGDAQNPQGDLFQASWAKIIVDANTQHFAGYGDFNVRGIEEVFTADAGLQAAYRRVS